MREKHYRLVLSSGQARFLATSKYGIDRMKALMSLVELASTESYTYEKKGFSTAIHVGQVVMSEVELSKLWQCDRKTVSKVLDMMSDLRLVSTRQNNRTSIHTLLCVSAWYLDGCKVSNPYFVPMKEETLPERGTGNEKETGNRSSASACATINPAQSEQNDAPQSGGVIPNGQASDTPMSTGTDTSYIYNKVETDGGSCNATDDKGFIGQQQQGKGNTIGSAASSSDLAKSFSTAKGEPSLFDDSNNTAVANGRTYNGVMMSSDNPMPPPAGGRPKPPIIHGSATKGGYRSMRDLQIDRLNQMRK